MAEWILLISFIVGCIFVLAAAFLLACLERIRQLEKALKLIEEYALTSMEGAGLPAFGHYEQLAWLAHVALKKQACWNI